MKTRFLLKKMDLQEMIIDELRDYDGGIPILAPAAIFTIYYTAVYAFIMLLEKNSSTSISRIRKK